MVTGNKHFNQVASMKDPYEPRIEVNGGHYYPFPYSGPVSKTIHRGLIPIGILATLSVASTLTLITLILRRVHSTRSEDNVRKFVGRNQYVLLVLNLLLADLQQSAAYLVSFYWYHMDFIVAPHHACFAQGWLLNSGDVSSAFFVLAIALHTYHTAVNGHRIGHKVFAAIVAAIWVFAYLLTAIGPALHGQKYFVRAGAWCWVSSAFESNRLTLHYVWVFLVEISTIVIYCLTFIALRRKTKLALTRGRNSHNSPSAATLKSINRVTMLMVVYPLVYVLLTLPLSASRMWSMSHHGKPTSDAFTVIAGSLLTSCGWVDSLLYSLTRTQLLKSTQGKPPEAATKSLAFSQGITQTKTVTITTHVLEEVPPVYKSWRYPSLCFQRPMSATESMEAMLHGEEHASSPETL